MKRKITDEEKETYLRDGGWICNGWWHPPYCLASWPLDEAYEMAKRDEDNGLRMTKQEVADYLAE